MEHLEGSARSKRHERLSRLRERSHVEEEVGDETVLGQDPGQDDGEIIATGLTLEGSSNTQDEADGDVTEDNESEADLIRSSGLVSSVRPCHTCQLKVSH